MLVTYVVLEVVCFYFFFNDTATTEIYTLSLHDALPICLTESLAGAQEGAEGQRPEPCDVTILRSLPGVGQIVLATLLADRKSTRLNSSHANISYAVFCLKKKKKINR